MEIAIRQSLGKERLTIKGLLTQRPSVPAVVHVEEAVIGATIEHGKVLNITPVWLVGSPGDVAD
jgi:hypothetical protein